MKQIRLIPAILFVIFAQKITAQVKSVTMLSAFSMVDSARITHYDSVVPKTYVYYTRAEASFDTLFQSYAYTKWTRRIGSGTYVDVIKYPMAEYDYAKYIRVRATDDTLKVGMVSKLRSVQLKRNPETPKMLLISIDSSITGGIHKISNDLRFADSSKMSLVVSLDANYSTKLKNKSWIEYFNRTIGDTVFLGNPPAEKKIYVWWTSETSAGKTELKYSFSTLPKPKAPLLQKFYDSIHVDESSMWIFGKSNGFGLLSERWATFNGKKSNLDTSIGIGWKNYKVGMNGLLSNTNYRVKVFNKTKLGIDSVDFGTIRTQEFIPKIFDLQTLGYETKFGLLKVIGKSSVPRGFEADISCGIFPFDDSLCTKTLDGQNQTIKGKSGIWDLNTSFDLSALQPGMYWGKYWGTCDDGQYDLYSAPIKIQIHALEIKTAQIKKWDVYPNPAVNQLNLPFEISYEVLNTIGKVLFSGYSDQIEVSDLASGSYYIKLKIGDYTINKSFMK